MRAKILIVKHAKYTLAKILIVKHAKYTLAKILIVKHAKYTLAKILIVKHAKYTLDWKVAVDNVPALYNIYSSLTTKSTSTPTRRRRRTASASAMLGVMSESALRSHLFERMTGATSVNRGILVNKRLKRLSKPNGSATPARGRTAGA